MKYYIITIGCQMNKSDSERMAAVLESQGLNESKERRKADIVVLVTCGIRQSAEDRIYGLINKIKNDNPKANILFTGCLAVREDIRKKLENRVDWWMPISEISNFQFPISNFQLKNINNCDYLKVRPKYNSKFSAFVPIGNGCDNFCTYCVVPYARGRENYRPAKEILDEVRGLVREGYKEITLIAQNVNSYRSRINTNSKRIKTIIDFSDLLKMVNDIPGNFWIRFATSHPKDMSDKLINAIAECEKVCRHIHLPVQSGDDDILKRMNRKYAIDDYVKLIKKIRSLLNFKISNLQTISNTKIKKNIFKPPVSITTDIIVGFPGETKQQFENTVKLFKKIKFDMAFIARYSPRPGTAASKSKDNVPNEEKKIREKKLTDILKKTSGDINKSYIGKNVEVLVESKIKSGEWFGRTRSNKVVKFNALSENIRIGNFFNVNIQRVKDFGLEGKVI